MTAASDLTGTVPARLIVRLLNSEDQVVRMWAAESVQAAVNLRARLLADHPGHAVDIAHLGCLLSVELEAVAIELDRAALHGGDRELSDVDRARRDGLASAAVVLRHRAGVLRSWRL
jgi:hypothetical protein